MSFAKWCGVAALLGMAWAASGHGKSTDTAIFCAAAILLIFMHEQRK